MEKVKVKDNVEILHERKQLNNSNSNAVTSPRLTDIIFSNVLTHSTSVKDLKTYLVIQY